MVGFFPLLPYIIHDSNFFLENTILAVGLIKIVYFSETSTMNSVISLLNSKDSKTGVNCVLWSASPKHFVIILKFHAPLWSLSANDGPICAQYMFKDLGIHCSCSSVFYEQANQLNPAAER